MFHRSQAGRVLAFLVVILGSLPLHAHEDEDHLHGHARPSEQQPTPLQQLKTYLLTRPTEGAPNRLERIALGAGSSVIALSGVAGGVLIGVFSVVRAECVNNLADCRPSSPTLNPDPMHQVRGRLAGDRQLLLADISFGVAAAFAILSVAALVTAFWPDGVWPMAGQ